MFFCICSIRSTSAFAWGLQTGPRIQAKAWPFVKWTLELEQWIFCTFSLIMSSLKSLWFSDCPIRPGGSSHMHFSWLYTRIHGGSWWIWFGFYLVASVSLVTSSVRDSPILNKCQQFPTNSLYSVWTLQGLGKRSTHVTGRFFLFVAFPYS